MTYEQMNALIEELGYDSNVSTTCLGEGTVMSRKADGEHHWDLSDDGTCDFCGACEVPVALAQLRDAILKGSE